MPGWIILGLVTAQRLGELVHASRNARGLIARGGYEVGRSHYPFMVALHAAWLAGLWVLAPGRPVAYVFLAVYLVLQAGRIWVLATLGRRWTTRVIVVPGERPTEGGPYRTVPHPNYLVVIGEIACLPLVFGLWWYALLFTVLNLAVLRVRVRVEEEALKSEGARSGCSPSD